MKRAYKILALVFACVVILAGASCKKCSKCNKDKDEVNYQENVNAVLDMIFFDETQISEVKGDMNLVTKNGKYPDVAISWTTSELDIVAADGTVTRPGLDDPRIKEGTEYVEVTVTVTASQGDASGQKSFVFCVYGEIKTDVSNVQAIKKSFYSIMQQEGLKYNAKSSDYAITAEVTGTLVYKVGTKGLLVNDGTGVIYAYGSTDANVGDTVTVKGGIYAYYGLIEFGSNVTVEKVDAVEVAAPVFEEKTIDGYISEIKAGLDADGKITDVDAFVNFSCAPYRLYAKVGAGNLGTNDSYYLEDPQTGTAIAIYHYCTDDAEPKAAIDAWVGKYVYINVYTYDEYSSGVFRVVWDGSEIVEAPEPQLTDAQKVEIALANLALADNANEDLELPVVEGVTYSLKEESSYAVVENGVLKVTRPAYGEGNATVVVVATAQFGEATGTKEFEVVIKEAPEEAAVEYVEVNEFKADVAYKLGFYQGNTSQQIWFAGLMDGNYGATVESATQGCDVYVVAVEGGYQLKLDVAGATKYLELVQSGTYVNVAVVDAPTLVWAYNAEYNTFTINFDGTDYYMGSYKTYTTLSASKLSYAATSFVSHLYEAKEVKVEYVEANEFAADKAYKLGFYQGNTSQQIWFAGLMDGNYGATTENPAEACDVYVVAVEGGYQLKLNVAGATKYLELVQSGTYVNVAVVDAPTLVWAYNAEYNTFTINFDGTDYYMGSYKTYTTLSASKLSYAATSFVSHLYSEETVEVEKVEYVEANEFNAETAYKLGFYQGNTSQQLWFTGVKDGNFGVTAETPEEGCDVYVVVVEGGYHLKLNVAGATKYLELVQSGTYVNVAVVDAPTLVWAYNAEYNTFTINFDGTDYYMGSYKTYTTLSASKLSYAATSFVSHLYEAKVVTDGGNEEEEENPIEGTKYSMAVTVAETTNMTGEGNEAASLGLDASIFTVTSTIRDTLYPGLGSDGTLRLYNPIEGDGNTVTITATGTITAIQLTFSRGAENCTILVNGEAVSAVDGVYTINASSFVIVNAGTAQFRISAMDIYVA